MANINFNYNQAMKQADQIDAIADEMFSLADNKYDNTIDALTACWKGEASQRFVNHCNVTKTDITTQAKKLRDAADKIRVIARTVKDAEEKVKGLIGK